MENLIEKAINDKIEEKFDEMAANLKEDVNEDVVMSAPDILSFLGGSMSYSTLIRQCHQGGIPCFRVGKQFFFRRKSILDWIEKQEKSIKK